MEDLQLEMDHFPHFSMSVFFWALQLEFWQVEWGALKGPANATKKDDMEFDAPDEEKIDGIVPELSQRQQDAEFRRSGGLRVSSV